MNDAPPPAAAGVRGMSQPGGGAKPVDPKVDWGRLYREGWKLLRLSPAMIALYAVVFLANGITGICVAQYWGNLTSSLTEQSQATTARGQAQGQDSSPANTDQSVAAATSRHGNRAALYILWAVLAFLVIALVIPQMWLQARMDIGMSNKLRAQVFSHALRQDPEFFHHFDPGRMNLLINSMTLDTQMLLRQLILDPPLQLLLFLVTIRQIIYNFKPLLHGVKGMTILGGIPVAWMVPVIGVVVIGFALLSPYLISRMAGGLRAKGRKVQESMFSLSSLVTSVGQSPEEIQLMEAEQFFSDKHAAALQGSLQARLDQQVAVGTLNVVDKVPTYFIQVMFVGIALTLAIMASGNAGVGIIVGSIVAILGLSAQIMAPVEALSRSLVMVSQSWPSAETIFGVLDRKARSDDDTNAGDKRIVETSIEAKNVTFAYAAGLPPVFQDLNFKIPPGRRTAFIAQMGQGKTSFFRLVLRFYDPQQGEILVGGIPTRSFTQDSIRGQVAMMSQFPSFFNASLRENMLIAKPSATDAELMALCERTGMIEVMNKKKITLDTPLVAGQILSGGEKKLLALTRCLLRDPAVLFLDEPTAGVDNVEKFKLLDMLVRATEGKTLVVVDHDVNWLLQFCDYFIGMDKGRVLEHGSLEEVLRQRGLIYTLYTVALGPKIKEVSRYVAEA